MTISKRSFAAPLRGRRMLRSSWKGALASGGRGPNLLPRSAAGPIGEGQRRNSWKYSFLSRRLSENEIVFSRSRKAKIITTGIHESISRIII